MCMVWSFLVLLINGCFLVLDNNFYLVLSFLFILELCIFGFFCVIFCFWLWDYIMKVFIGCFILFVFFLLVLEFGDFVLLLLRLVWGFGECCWGWLWEWELCIFVCWGLIGMCIFWEDGGSCVCLGFGKFCLGRFWYFMRVFYNFYIVCVLFEWKWIKFKFNWDDKMINFLVFLLFFNNMSWIFCYFFFIWLIWFIEYEILIWLRINIWLVV